MLRILIYTFIMAIAIYLGKKGFYKDYLKDKIGKIQTVLLVILLFIMGIGIGKNKDIINSIHLMGLKSIILAFSSIVFSVLIIYLYNRVYNKFIYKKLLKNKKK